MGSEWAVNVSLLPLVTENTRQHPCHNHNPSTGAKSQTSTVAFQFWEGRSMGSVMIPVFHASVFACWGPAQAHLIICSIIGDWQESSDEEEQTLRQEDYISHLPGRKAESSPWACADFYRYFNNFIIIEFAIWYVQRDALMEWEWPQQCADPMGLHKTAMLTPLAWPVIPRGTVTSYISPPSLHPFLPSFLSPFLPTPRS